MSLTNLSVTLKYSLYFSFITLLGFVSLYYTRDIPESYWLLWVTIAFSFINRGKTLARRVSFILGIGILAAILCFMAGWIGSNIYIAIFYLFLITYFFTYASQYFIDYFYVCVFLNFFIILAGLVPLELAENLQRSAFILGGSLIVVISQILFWRYFSFNHPIWYVRNSIEQLGKLNEEIFSCLIDYAYSDNLYLFENRIHRQKQNFLMSKTFLEELIVQSHFLVIPAKAGIHLKHPLVNKLTDFVSICNAIFDNLMDIAQLRLRITDPATLELCHKEINEISEQIVNCFLEIENSVANKNTIVDMSLLNNTIFLFEESYQSVLKVSANDPVIFVLFLASLQSLSEKINDLQLVVAVDDKI